ncbi:hypothetical protein QBC39DRAFT_345098 [Podospora conica]|nr:hypothetical protein QBC39DRAFT_345098 [Schizothecium conicum]
MPDSSDSESSPSTPEKSTHETATGEPNPKPQAPEDTKGDSEEDGDDDNSSASSRNSSPSDEPGSPPPKTQYAKETEQYSPPSASRIKELENQHKERVEADKRQAEAKIRQDRIDEAKRLEEVEAQTRRRAFVETPPPQTGYLCGDCGATLFLGRGDPVRCRGCGCRILYKKKTTRLVDSRSPVSSWGICH